MNLSEVVGPPLEVPEPILHRLIQASVLEHHDKIALVCEHQPSDLIPGLLEYGATERSSDAAPYLEWTHAQLQHAADLLAIGLTRHGVQAGSTIAVLLSGRAEFHVILRAAVKLNCPFAPISTRSVHNPTEIRHMLTLSDTKVIFVEDAVTAEALEKTVPDLLQAMQVKIIIGSALPAGISGAQTSNSSSPDASRRRSKRRRISRIEAESRMSPYLSFNDIVAEAAKDQAFKSESLALDSVSRNLDDVVFIWFTSGTTSLPKAAPHTNLSLCTNARSWQQSFQLSDKNVWLHALPMNSIVGSSWTTAYLTAGGSVVHVAANFDVHAISKSIATGQNTDILLVPSMIDLLASSTLLASKDNRGIERVIVGGSKILRSHMEKSFDILKCKQFSPFFGMTEGTSCCHETYLEPPLERTAPVFSGCANPGAKLRICVPEATDIVARGQPGELVQGGKQRIEYYLGGQGRDSFFADDKTGEIWFRTGDQAVMSEDGRIEIVGRYKDMIIRGGMNIASAAVEAVIGESTKIDAQVIGVPDDVAGEVPVAIIKTISDDAASRASVQKCVLERLGRSYALERVLRLQDLGLDEWPKTTSGKILKRDLQKLTVDRLKQEQSKGTSVHGSAEKRRRGHLRMSEAELQDYLLQRLHTNGIMVATIDDDFHSAGMDSLSAMQLHSAIVSNVDLGTDEPIPPKIIFEAGTIRELAAAFLSQGRHQHDNVDGNVAKMAAIVERYNQFQKRRPRTKRIPNMHTVLLTGTTGSLGAHLLAQLLDRSDVHAVYCPVRGDNPSQRVETALRQRFLHHPEHTHKIKIVAFDVSKSAFGLDGTTLEILRNNLSLIIHAAWPVNFQLSLSSFEPHVKGLQSLIQLSLDVNSDIPAQILFCSSMGVALGTQGQKTIPEEPMMDFRQASSSGYTQSKLVSEFLLQTAVEKFSARASNLRIGQVVGDTVHGFWNDHEAPPMMIRSALTLGTLPELDIVRPLYLLFPLPLILHPNPSTDIPPRTCSWLPVDTLATSILEIATAPLPNSQPRLVYNLCSPLTFHWTSALIPALAATGQIPFTPVPFAQWLSQLKAFRDDHSVEDGMKLCPAVKLVGFWEESYGGDQLSSGLAEGPASALPSRDLRFETGDAQAVAPSLREAPDVIRSGLVQLMVGAWMKRWAVNKGDEEAGGGEKGDKGKVEVSGG